jgi:hypothetical protein
MAGTLSTEKVEDCPKTVKTATRKLGKFEQVLSLPDEKAEKMHALNIHALLVIALYDHIKYHCK